MADMRRIERGLSEIMAEDGEFERKKLDPNQSEKRKEKNKKKV